MRVGYYVHKHNDTTYIPYILIQRGMSNTWNKAACRIRQTRYYKTEKQAEAVCKKYILHYVDYYPWSYVGRVGGFQADLNALPILQAAKPFWPKYNHKRVDKVIGRYGYKLKKPMIFTN